MTSSNGGQVALSDLLFAQSWEDIESDRKALAIAPGDALFCITSGGCNALGFLLEDPAVVYAVDINRSQSHLLQLKIAAMRHLPFDEFAELLGLRPSTRRGGMLDALLPSLSPDAALYWRERRSSLQGGILGQGRYERFLRLFRRGLRALQGRKRIEGLFRTATLEEQRDFYDRVWNTRRWHLLFRLVFNKRMLARRGLSADYFRFDDGTTSFSESFYQRAGRAFRDLPLPGNYFLAQYLLGRYLTERDVPDYLKEENYATIRSRLDRIVIVTEDAKMWLAGVPPGRIDAFSLSNICELMSVQDAEITFDAVAHAAKPGARICFRNLMIPRSVPERLAERIVRDDALSRMLLLTDRSVVYSKVDAYTVA